MSVTEKHLPSIAVVLHLFHLDLWPQFKERLTQLPATTDLFITTPDFKVNDVKRLVLQDFLGAKIFGFENKGRDVGPLVELNRLVPLHEYDLVLKVHSKKSTHKKGTQGDDWRDELLEGLLPTGRTQLIFDFFSSNPQVGIAGPDQYLTPIAQSFYHPDSIRHWNRITESRTQYPDAAQFFAGTMFWARGAVFHELAKLKVKQSDFEIESGQIEGTLAHALERYFPLLAFDQGLTVAGFNFSDASRWASKRTLTESQINKFSQFFSKFNDSIKLHVVIKASDSDLTVNLNRTTESLKDAASGLICISTEVLVASTDAKTFYEIIDNCSATNFDWLLFVKAGDEFTRSGLLICMSQLASNNDLLAAYTDKLIRAPSGNVEAALLPEFDSDLLMSFPWFMSNHWFFSSNAIQMHWPFKENIGSFFELDFILKLTRNSVPEKIVHIAELLLTTSEPSASENESLEFAAINEDIQLVHGHESYVQNIKPRLYRAVYSRPDSPLVSIVIRNENLSETQGCIESLLEFTSYKHYEILIVAASKTTGTFSAWVKGLIEIDPVRFRLVTVENFENFATASNQAVNVARGTHILFSNCATRFIEPTWLDALLNHALRVEVGVVGAKIINPDLIVEQSGVVLGLHGISGTAFKGEHWNSPGYMQRANVDQQFNAIASNCMILSKQYFLELQGFDSSIASTRLSQIDLCLRLRSNGFKIIWTPHSIVATTHSDSNFSLEKSDDFFLHPPSEETRILLSKWLPKFAKDSSYNPNFTFIGKSFTLEPDPEISFRPITWRPDPVVLIHPSDNFGCGHYRLIQPLKAMETEGLVDGICTFRPLLPVELERIQPDTIIFQKPFQHSVLEYMKHSKSHSNSYKIYEIDDLIHRLPMKNPDRKKFPSDLLRIIKSGVSLADKLIVSTPGLAEAVSDWHSNIQILELKLPTDWWLNLEIHKTEHKKPRVGWAGGSSHRGDLELIFDVVKNLSNEVDWVFLGMCPEQLRPYVKEFHVGVSIDVYPQKLASLDLDLALAPLENSQFNDCKSNLRLLEYGVCGYPVICSDTRAYVESGLPVQIVKNRYKDWVDAIRQHIDDLQTSTKIGHSLKAEVLDNWMLSSDALNKWTKAWLR